MKAIFFDIDGTLLSHKYKAVPVSTREALKKLKENGHFIFIATGRHITEMRDLPLEGLKFDGYITLNGQYCYNDKEVIYDLPIHQDDINRMIESIDHDPFPCIFVEDQQMYINFNNEQVQIVQDAISTPLPVIGDLHRGYTHNIYQVIPYDMTKKEMIIQLMPHCKINIWHPLAFDMIPADGGKQNGILKILEYYHVDLKDTIAIGDGLNDIEMLDLVHFAIAMGNADEEVKQHADFVTTDVDHDGIYNALKEINLI